MRSVVPLLTVFWLAIFVGCQPKPPITTPVSGVVLFNGVACDGANVTFVPVAGTAGNGGAGQTDAEGKFEIRLLLTGQKAPGPAGLLPGKYKVTISKAVNPDGTPYVPDPNVAPIDATWKELLPAIYSDYEQTTLQEEVGLASLNLTYKLQSVK